MPLCGRRVLVTRAEHQAGRLASELARLGAEPVELPAIRILPPESYDLLDAALCTLAVFDWMIVTSANTVHAIANRLAALGLAGETSRLPFPMPKLAAVGPATARAMERMGWAVELLPEKYVAESLLAALGERLHGARVLLARSARARGVIPDALRAQGIDVTVVDAYRTEIPPDSIEKARQLFGSEGERLDAATFTSSSTVENFLELLRAAQAPAPPVVLPAISIGPVTSRTLCEAGWPPVAEADPHTVEGLVAAVLKVLA
jgi:uroporphyrinogen-III synthase